MNYVEIFSDDKGISHLINPESKIPLWSNRWPDTTRTKRIIGLSNSPVVISNMYGTIRHGRTGHGWWQKKDESRSWGLKWPVRSMTQAHRLMNKINPRKLLNSKWTAVTPVRKEKHFMVTEVEFDEEGIVTLCSIESLISKRSIPINWHDLTNENNWVQGWK